jgi:site-specific DNA-cytosine methylase
MPRYQAVGNSMPVPVIRWIGQRIKFIDPVIFKQG